VSGTKAAALALAAAALAGLPGCGGDDDAERAGDRRAPRTESAPTERSRTTAERDGQSLDRSGEMTERKSSPSPSVTVAEPKPAAPPSAVGLPPKAQRAAAADNVCLATRSATGQTARRPDLERLCDAMRAAARADTPTEYQRALRSAIPAPRR
jgi:hypothetical protein